MKAALRGLRPIGPGLLLCTVVALAALFVSEQHGGPALLYALLLGLAFHFLGDDPRLRPGIDFCARSLLRAGVALLGLRIGVGQVAALGWPTAAWTVAAVALTIAFGLALARLLRRPPDEGLISGCAVGICGASAALAVSAALPASRANERFTLLAVVGVTLLSTLAMVLYPLGVRALGLGPQQAGVFLGATIHDVAQVVAAATLLSADGDPTAADSATVVKLLRVLLLAPVVAAVVLWRRHAGSVAGLPLPRSTPLVPGFLLAFVACVLLHSAGLVPDTVERQASALSRLLLVLAIVAAGMKTSLAELRTLGWSPVLMLGAETALLAGWVGLGLVWWL